MNNALDIFRNTILTGHGAGTAGTAGTAGDRMTGAGVQTTGAAGTGMNGVTGLTGLAGVRLTGASHGRSAASNASARARSSRLTTRYAGDRDVSALASRGAG